MNAPWRVAALAVAALSVSSLGAAPARAAAPFDEFDRRGPYAGIGAAWGKYTSVEDPLRDALAERGYTGDIETESAAGLTARLGYRLHANIAAELVFDYFPQAVNRLKGANFEEFQDGDSFSDFVGYALSINMKPYFMTGRIQPFAQIGFGILHGKLQSTIVGIDTNESNTGIAGRFGAGVDVYVTRHIAVTADVAYMLPSGSVEPLDQVIVGLGLLLRY